MTQSLGLPLVLATGNTDKARELSELLSDALDRVLVSAPVTVGDKPIGFVVEHPDRFPATLAAMTQLDEAPDVEEIGTTLEENARIKARGVGTALGLLAVADDTGLEIDALGGAPGVYAARYAGPDATYADNVNKALRELDGVAPLRRTARFATVVVARTPSGDEVVVRGEVEGLITSEPHGTNGFGYDSIFEPLEGDGRTFAQMSADEKHALSHRGRALRALVARVKEDEER
ncbi:MAG TPA: RdgB/HAM1 family non-canonical purine NTP pyrophosphatase [Acidimicrobiia bacterium]|jgi:XTP/dITP diphosphohydrolase|nr:RdgB/HAM1 family non-canonical purine NTP pyrophosphatase [Acidimicrobiia bacterium]